ncbi:MAG TPA: type II toxin-antitoxin system PemK/MazF family toxin [Candidatus Kapabacteria bacterium]|nr:type II toxin-antitoxin system PemK/MazF family toxin [Candidatus Kapabacteria bacterium]
MDKDYCRWNIFKEKLNKRKEIYFRKGEIWWCALGINVGYEQDGKNKNFERPVLVLRKINRHLALVLPLSSKIKDHPYYYRYRHDGKLF